MSPVRAYVPSTLGQLAGIIGSGGIGPVPVRAHAVTEDLREGLPDGDDEEWEYVALSAAAQDSIGLLEEEDVQRRVVIAVDVSSVVPSDSSATAVEIHEVVPARKIAAVHVDSQDAEDDVRAARQAWVASTAGDASASEVVERCLDHELGWFATQEIASLLES